MHKPNISPTVNTTPIEAIYTGSNGRLGYRTIYQGVCYTLKLDGDRWSVVETLPDDTTAVQKTTHYLSFENAVKYNKAFIILPLLLRLGTQPSNETLSV